MLVVLCEPDFPRFSGTVTSSSCSFVKQPKSLLVARSSSPPTVLVSHSLNVFMILVYSVRFGKSALQPNKLW
jgi:hypothetical protein